MLHDRGKFEVDTPVGILPPSKVHTLATFPGQVAPPLSFLV